MGSRAVVDRLPRRGRRPRAASASSTRASGICYTRTGRRFFDDAALEQAFLDRIRRATDAAGLWDELDDRLVLLDCELMPWSAKAQELLREQYAAVGAAGRGRAHARPSQALDAGVSAASMSAALRARRSRARRDDVARVRRCLPPLLLARRAGSTTSSSRRSTCSRREGAVHVDKPHSLAHGAGWPARAPPTRSCSVRPRTVAVDSTDPTSEATATAWWEELTGAGGEGMVVKPLGVRRPRPTRARAAGA